MNAVPTATPFGLRALELEGVRCFRQVAAPLTPLTLLVGENSTGKSTLLALTRIAWDVLTGGRTDFNEEPFELGAYDDIARYHGGKGKRVTHFVIAGQFGPLLKPSSETVHFRAVFYSQAGQPQVYERSLSFSDVKMTWTLVRDGSTWRITAPSGDATFRFPGSINLLPFGVNTIFPLRSLAHLAQALPVQGQVPDDADVRRLDSVIMDLSKGAQTGRPYAFAPIRTRPRRTYDPLHASSTPEGEHVPPTLARVHAGGQEDWYALATELRHFGEASGMFDSVDVRHLGKQESDPFKILVRIKGQRATPPLIDVGYGVSQVLPILVDAVRAAGTFLLQQPEVHLHPRAQAELGSFLGRLVARGQQFVVETHSDHLLGRICHDVRMGRDGLRPEHVSIVYFERHHTGVRVHPISVDKLGNLVGAPPSYREFFLREELRTIGCDVPNR